MSGAFHLPPDSHGLRLEGRINRRRWTSLLIRSAAFVLGFLAGETFAMVFR